jgi:hypothetical protein
VYGHYQSVLHINLLFCCQRFGWKIDDFMLGLLSGSRNNNSFLEFCIVGVRTIAGSSIVVETNLFMRRLQ